MSANKAWTAVNTRAITVAGYFLFLANLLFDTADKCRECELQPLFHNISHDQWVTEIKLWSEYLLTWSRERSINSTALLSISQRYYFSAFLLISPRVLTIAWPMQMTLFKSFIELTSCVLLFLRSNTFCQLLNVVHQSLRTVSTCELCTAAESISWPFTTCCSCWQFVGQRLTCSSTWD